MFFVRDPDNVLTDSDAENQAELHLRPGDLIEVIMPSGKPVYLHQYKDGLEVQDAFGSHTTVYPDN